MKARLLLGGLDQEPTHNGGGGDGDATMLRLGTTAKEMV
eukprot:gene34442-44496_t